MAKKTAVTVRVNSGRRWEATATVRRRLVSVVVTGGKQNWKCTISTGTGPNAIVEERELVVDGRQEAIATALGIAGISNPSFIKN